jgi:hypothetical protein
MYMLRCIPFVPVELGLDQELALDVDGSPPLRPRWQLVAMVDYRWRLLMIRHQRNQVFLIVLPDGSMAQSLQ